MFREIFLLWFGKKEDVVEDVVEEVKVLHIPDFARDFCFPEDLDKREFGEWEIRYIAQKMSFSLSLIREKYKDCDSTYWGHNRYGHGTYHFLDFEINIVDRYGNVPIEIYYLRDMIGRIDRGTIYYSFFTNYPELRNRVLFMCEYLIGVGERIREENAQKLLDISRKHDCRNSA